MRNLETKERCDQVDHIKGSRFKLRSTNIKFYILESFNTCDYQIIIHSNND